MLKSFEVQGVSVKLEDVTKRFDTFTAVNQLSLIAEPGQITTLLGPSGCGKTTTLRMLAGFYFPEAGEIYIDDEPISNLPPHKRPTRTVFQSYALFPHMTVFQNVAFSLRLQKLSKQAIKEEVETALSLVGLLEKKDDAPGKLSGGQQQRVALARALASHPKVLLLDEPLSNLDAKLREQMRDEIRALQQRLGITTIYVTHDQAEAMSISDKIAVMNEGRLEQVDIPQNIYQKPASAFVAQFIGQANFIKAKVESLSNNTGTISFFSNKLTVPVKGYSLKANDDIFIIIRPEAVQIKQSDANDADLEGYTGLVQQATYLGPMVEYKLTINNHPILAVDWQPYRHKIYQPGDSVQVSFAKDSFHFLKQ